MLQSIHVKNLALIEETEVEFAPGFNIVTGETGAGKSLLIGSVTLALGSKFDASMLRKGAENGFVELVFSTKDARVSKKLEEMEITPDDEGTVIITRKLSQGKSSCKINGETVTIKQVQDIAEDLIDIHGQHEHQSLLKKSKHLQIIDAYGEEETKPLLEKTAECFEAHRQILDKIEKEKKSDKDIEREKSLLEYELKEIEDAQLVEGEDEEKEVLFRRMSNARKIVTALSETYGYTSDGETDAASLIGMAIRSLSNASQYDERLNTLESQLSDMESLLNDFNREISSYMSDYDFEEEEFREVESRLDTINTLKKKYGPGIKDVLEYATDCQEKLKIFEDYETYMANLEAEELRTGKELQKVCEELSKVRSKLAVKLSEQLKASLVNLNFLTVEFEIKLSKTTTTSKGFDEAQFFISTNPGENLKPLENVASGGELSRIMLGIKTVMAAKDHIDTLIFDEIDSGISGRTAWKVSEQLGLLGKQHQVLCITHLPQIAAMADAHFIIEKTADQMTTITNVRFIKDEESVSELARLLGSDEESDAALENARDMRAKALEYKNNH